jgi:hypothetical protein
VLGAAIALDVNGFLVKPIRTGVVKEKFERAVQEPFHVRAQADYESVVTALPSLEEAKRQAGASRARAAGNTRIDKAQKQISLTQMREGMRLAKDLAAKDGAILIYAGTVLTELFINRVQELSSVLMDEFVEVLDPT